MSVPEWDLKRIYREAVMAVIVGLLAWVALQMTEMKVLQAESAVRIEQCIKDTNDQAGILAEHDGRIHRLEIDVNTLKVQTSVP